MVIASLMGFVHSFCHEKVECRDGLSAVLLVLIGLKNNGCQRSVALYALRASGYFRFWYGIHFQTIHQGRTEYKWLFLLDNSLSHEYEYLPNDVLLHIFQGGGIYKV